MTPPAEHAERPRWWPDAGGAALALWSPGTAFLAACAAAFALHRRRNGLNRE